MESSGGSRGGMDVVASLLRLSEGFMRAENSPEDFTNVGRKLRADLTGVLSRACGRGNVNDME